jgi:hypothetical protein
MQGASVVTELTLLTGPTRSNSDIRRQSMRPFYRIRPTGGGSPVLEYRKIAWARQFVAAERRPVSLWVVTLDDRLADAMRNEGFAE